MYHFVIGNMHATNSDRICALLFRRSVSEAFFLSLLSFQTAVGTALPVIVQSLNGDEFVWVGSAYTLGSTALIPFCGGLAQVRSLREHRN